MTRIRLWIARHFMSAALNIVTTPPTFEGLTAMTILARLAAVEAANTALAARVAELEGKSVDTSGFATADSVTALGSKVDDLASTVGSRVDAIEAEIGTDPAPAADPAPDQPQG
jgi:hypothetical protein